ncbi:hypothetical protein [Solwaraspora sp. WMMA2101]|uniref:hypothetical protein n=1 Tax=Solwaraspora sp. WMMA2101 TaxID=3404124 RepID=UPI003B96337E
MSTLNRAASVAVASVAVLALTACGGAQPAAEVAAGGGTGVLTQLATDAVGSLQRTIETTNKATSVKVTMTGTAGGESMDMSGVIAFGDEPKAELTMVDPEDGEITVRTIGTTYYVSIPEAEQASMEGKKWFKMDLAALGAGSEELAKQVDDMDPVKGVQTLLDGKEVVVVGEETIDGVKTVHYTSTSPVETYLGQLDAELREGVQEQLAAAGVTEVKADVWVDEQYQPRRVKMVMGTMSDITVDYTDYGTPVSIEAPAEAETLDFAEMFGDLQDLLADVEA